MWPFKQKLNLFEGCLVAHAVEETTEDPSFEKVKKEK